ncbi:MAG: hypothetical protein WBG50_07915, partial [Desulfomonilaceae bacterium]
MTYSYITNYIDKWHDVKLIRGRFIGNPGARGILTDLLIKAFMGKRGKKGKSRHAAERVENQVRNPQAAPDSPGLPRRGFFRDLIIGLIVCTAFFGTLEVGLRFAGIPNVPDKGDPYVGFSALQPLFLVKDGKASTAIKKLKYFNQVSFPVQKRPGT